MRAAIFTLGLSMAAVIFSACGSTKTAPSQYKFVFSHEGQDYEIISTVVASNGGHNYLTRRDDGELVFSAKDVDQDGTLDMVIVGDVGLSDANVVYVAGIDQARRTGRYREQTGARTFEYKSLGYTYVIQSFQRDSGEWYNTFLHFDVDGHEVLCVDTDADGILDSISRGTDNLQQSQDFYQVVLQEGLRRSRIEIRNDSYEVLPS
jgi:hypothetical protein